MRLLVRMAHRVPTRCSERATNSAGPNGTINTLAAFFCPPCFYGYGASQGSISSTDAWGWGHVHASRSTGQPHLTHTNTCSAVVKDLLETSDRTHYPDLYADGCGGCLFCNFCPATTAWLCGCSGPCCGCYNVAWKLGTLMNIVRPKP